MKLRGTWGDLDTRGFVVIEGFLSEAELAEQRALVSEVDDAPIKLYYAQKASDVASRKVSQKIATLLPEIRAGSSVCVDAVFETGNYFRPQKTSFDWHSDAMSYHFHQNLYHYLNFWIPIVKPDPERSGMSVIPIDSLAAKNPAAAAALRGKGDAEYMDGRLDFENDGRSMQLDIHPDETAFTPPLRAGDALVVRGDVLHQTQDGETERIALSVRAYNLEQRVTKAQFLTMGPRKYNRLKMEKSLATVGALAVFWEAGDREVSIRDMFAAKQRIESRDPKTLAYFVAAKLLFPLVLWWHRPRGGAGSGAQPDVRPKPRTKVTT